jgi:hypothetical protein
MITSDLETLDSFETISLDEMDSVKLLDRVDSKFIFRRDQLPAILSELKPFYRVLNNNHSGLHRYETIYFDTPGLLMYLQHHNGKLNRWKVRSRKYLDSDQCFFEIKFKSNKSRTKKERIKVPETGKTIEGESGKFLTKKTPFLPGMLRPVFTVIYDRITLVGKTSCERLTIDSGLRFRNEREEFTCPLLVIAELKQEATFRSPFVILMHQLHIHKMKISKYCLGVTNMFPEIKKNNFKKKLRQINKLNHANT